MENNTSPSDLLKKIEELEDDKDALVKDLDNHKAFRETLIKQRTTSHTKFGERERRTDLESFQQVSSTPATCTHRPRPLAQAARSRHPAEVVNAQNL